MRTRLLDCTLREGSHLNGGRFGQKTIKNIIKKTTRSGIDIIEIGFLNNNEDRPGTSNFNDIKSAEQTLDQCETNSETEYAVMVRPDRFDVSQIQTRPKQCSVVRIAFYQKDISEAIEAGRVLKSKGFDIFLNPIATSTYSNNNITNISTEINDLLPRGINLVDTFGSLTPDRAQRIYELLDDNLNEKITIGAHLHQNLGLSRSISQRILSNRSISRDIIIDGALYGMGRSPGNLQTELIADRLSENGNSDYLLEPLFEVIDSEIKPLKERYDWGYSPEYFISAKYNVHRTYAERMKEKGESLQEINNVCRFVSENSDTVEYDKALVEQYYDE